MMRVTLMQKHPLSHGQQQGPIQVRHEQMQQFGEMAMTLFRFFIGRRRLFVIVFFVTLAFAIL